MRYCTIVLCLCTFPGFVFAQAEELADMREKLEQIEEAIEDGDLSEANTLREQFEVKKQQYQSKRADNNQLIRLARQVYDTITPAAIDERNKVRLLGTLARDLGPILRLNEDLDGSAAVSLHSSMARMRELLGNAKPTDLANLGAESLVDQAFPNATGDQEQELIRDVLKKGLKKAIDHANAEAWETLDPFLSEENLEDLELAGDTMTVVKHLLDFGKIATHKTENPYDLEELDQLASSVDLLSRLLPNNSPLPIKEFAQIAKLAIESISEDVQTVQRNRAISNLQHYLDLHDRGDLDREIETDISTGSWGIDPSWASAPFGQIEPAPDLELQYLYEDDTTGRALEGIPCYEPGNTIVLTGHASDRLEYAFLAVVKLPKPQSSDDDHGSEHSWELKYQYTFERRMTAPNEPGDYAARLYARNTNWEFGESSAEVEIPFSISASDEDCDELSDSQDSTASSSSALGSEIRQTFSLGLISPGCCPKAAYQPDQKEVSLAAYDSGDVTVTLTVGDGESAGSFNLFFRARGGAWAEVGHAYDVRPGASRTLRYRFNKPGDILFSSVGNWFSREGSTNTVSVEVVIQPD